LTLDVHHGSWKQEVIEQTWQWSDGWAKSLRLHILVLMMRVSDWLKDLAPNEGEKSIHQDDPNDVSFLLLLQAKVVERVGNMTMSRHFRWLWAPKRKEEVSVATKRAMTLALTIHCGPLLGKDQEWRRDTR
jgi:hypothetical protein